MRPQIDLNNESASATSAQLNKSTSGFGAGLTGLVNLLDGRLLARHPHRARPAPRVGNLWLTPPSYTSARQLASKSVAQPGASAITIQFASPPPVRPPKIDDGHRAVLTYQAMADFDDIVLILEYDGNACSAMMRS